MKLLKQGAILICTVLLLAASGCSFLGSKPLYLPSGSAVEVKTAGKIEVWITNASTGLKEARTLEVSPGYLIARPAVKDCDLPEDQAIKK